MRINLGAESAAMLEKTRRAINDLQSSVKESLRVAIESAGDDLVQSVRCLNRNCNFIIQRTLKSLNKGYDNQALTSDLNLVEDLLLTLRDVVRKQQVTSSLTSEPNYKLM